MKFKTFIAAIAGLGMHTAVATANQPTYSVKGRIEVNASSSKAYDGTKSDTLGLGKARLTVKGQPSKDVSAKLVIQAGGKGKYGVDTATMTLKLPASLSLTTGRTTAPFGRFNTALISDPMTKNMAKMDKDILMLGFSKAGASVSLYVFDPDTEIADKDNKVDGSGAEVGYSKKMGKIEVDVAVGYISHLTDGKSFATSKTVTAEDGTESSLLMKKAVTGTSASLKVAAYGAGLVFEQVSAGEAFDQEYYAFKESGAKPSSMHIELSYGLKLSPTCKLTFAAMSDATEQAIGMGLPKSSSGVIIGANIMGAAYIGIENRTDTDYKEEEGGTGKTRSVSSLRFATSF